MLTRALTELSSGEIKNDMHGWTVDFRVDPKKKKENAKRGEKKRKKKKREENKSRKIPAR